VRRNEYRADGAAGPAEFEAARLLLARMGITPADLLGLAPARSPAPTFAEYIPIVSASVGDGARRVYGSYWNRILKHWSARQLDQRCSMLTALTGRYQNMPLSLADVAAMTSGRSRHRRGAGSSTDRRLACSVNMAP
jgi:hypothetical protein